MKTSSLLLALSLSANVALVGALVVGQGRVVNGDSETAPAAATTGAKVSAGGAATRGTFDPVPRSEPAPAWPQLYSENLEDLVGRLRAAGFPPAVIRWIAVVMNAERTDAIREKLFGEQEGLPYWRIRAPSDSNSEKQAEFAKAMAASQEVFRKLFLGAEAIRDDPELAEAARRRYGDLPMEKLMRLARIEEDYGELREKITFARRELTLEDREKLAILDEEQRRDLRGALSPEEYERFQLLSGPTASMLREGLDAFQPTEEEFRALVALYWAEEDAFPARWRNDSGTVAARARATERIEQQIETVLSPERHADYRQALAGDQRRVNNLLARINLPLRTGGQIEDLRRDITQRAEAVRANASLPFEERAARLGELEQEARSRVSAALGGDRNLAAYEDIKGWIRDLRPKL